MKYYLIAGEASGDLHASNLMRALQQEDKEAQFRFFGGDLMASVGGTRVKHYRELAYMGFIPVLLHLPTILSNMEMCKRDIREWNPDVVILIDYPGFNLDIARYVKKHTQIPVFYYISPKIWAWKEYRIKDIKQHVDALFSILPFEIDFFEKKHQYPIEYVGNPCVDAVEAFKKGYKTTFQEFAASNRLDAEKPIIALLAGSRKQEIKDNLPQMIEAASRFPEYQVVLAGAPGIEPDYYSRYIQGDAVKVVFGATYQILFHAQAALVTSGTATLETCLLRVPQVVCYDIAMGRIISFLRKLVLKVPYISLVNLIAGKEVVPELVADGMTTENVHTHLKKILAGSPQRDEMLKEYEQVIHLLGPSGASQKAAQLMASRLKVNKSEK